ncbi:TetR/AcrR family transcriptional regulator [Cupriavidus gilardii]|uniref:TetR/AcrR family transcriptional regulator n=1 Tax=Cupriavidus gilardii TaxID=82541 RepID=UPI0021C11152|nr:TetR/AcrR family transcriptional regulator [Cupriavidus gilardii]MCT9119159.1 TetR/AcrR family transcriptional regulator [Cupriavidus gilardii]
MPRSSREKAGQNREAIEQASSRLFRERGLTGISVADVMGAAGLTHGGFYSHFASKDALAATACDRAFGEALERWRQRIDAHPGDADAARAAVVVPYLSERHRDAPGAGCAGVALAADVARESADKPVRQSYIDGLEGLIAQWERTLPGPDDTRRGRALAEMAMMMGAVMLARATQGAPLSEQILSATLAALTRPVAGEDRPPSRNAADTAKTSTRGEKRTSRPAAPED